MVTTKPATLCHMTEFTLWKLCFFKLLRYSMEDSTNAHSREAQCSARRVALGKSAKTERI